MPRRLPGFTPSGNLHLENYVGALRPIITEQSNSDTVVFISDLHALTLEHDPAEVRRRTLEFATLLLAAGADPDACLFPVQSRVPEHTELHYLLECTTGYGEVQRMIQFKEKSRRQQQVRTSLLTYPILMAADILLYDTDEVPVGADQRQHVELARDLTRATAFADFLLTAPCRAVLWRCRPVLVGAPEKAGICWPGLAVCVRCRPGAGPGLALNEQVRSGGAPAP